MPPAADASPPGPWALFRAFLGVGLSGFGGVLPFARRMLVDERQWLTETGFTESLALCQTLPGPNIINLTIVVGSRFAGPIGSLSALAGLTLAPVAIVLIIATLYGRYGTLGRLPAMITGLGAGAAGLVIATAARLATPLIRARPLSAGPFILLAFVGVGLMRLPLVWVIAALVPLSIAVAHRWSR